MRNKGFSIAMLALIVLSVVQIPIMAANNQQQTDEAFQEERYVGRYRQARDHGSSELISGANTSIATYFDNDGNREQLVWTSSASASYTGDDLMYVTDYDIKSKVLDYTRSEVISLLGANTGRSTFLAVTMRPPPDNVNIHIDDCEAHGKADGTDSFGNQVSTHSEIPFP
ncbi:MAG: hypothetical protein OXI67_09960 [Candidatus Poribacteria bacterium]|nr:hypothetical protein [Candidatus Poribacteria bacterium]